MSAVEIQYDKDITLKGLSGNFLITIMAERKERWFAGSDTTKISGALNSVGDVVLERSADGYILKASVPVNTLSVFSDNEVRFYPLW